MQSSPLLFFLKIPSYIWIHYQQMYAEGRELAVHGYFTFVAIDEHKKPVKIIQ